MQFSQTVKTAVINTDSGLYATIDQSYNEQLDRARKILPRQIVAYERLVGRLLNCVLEVNRATGAYAHAFEKYGISYTGMETESDVANKAHLPHRTEYNQREFSRFQFGSAVCSISPLIGARTCAQSTIVSRTRHNIDSQRHRPH